MTMHEEDPELRGEVALTDGEIEKFQAEILWPAANYEWGGSLESAVAGDDDFKERTRGGVRASIHIEAYLDIEGQGERSEPELVRLARVTIQKAAPELKTHMLQLAAPTISDTECEEYELLRSESGQLFDEHDLLVAWQIVSFCFRSNNPRQIEVSDYHALQDEVGNDIWSNEEPEDNGDEVSTLSEQEKVVCADLFDQLGTTFTSDNRQAVIQALAMLGIPVDLLI